jgi:cell division protein FtsW
VAGFSFQPSEFVKYLLPAYFIQRALAEEKGGWTLWRFFKLMALPIFAIVLIMVEPNNGTAAVVGMLLIVLCVLIRLPFKFWGIPLLMLALAGSVFAYNHPYIAARIQVYLHPELDLKGRGHQPHQARIAVGSGGLWGRGPGNSLQKLSYLPEAQNDYIAAIYAEEFGFMGMVLLVALYSAIAAISYAIAIAARDRHGFYLAAAILFLISFQAFLNLAVVSGLLPSTGLNLPFFSQGGSSLVANMVAIALLLSIAAPCNQKVYNQHSAQL